jgi:hypothetical protein
MNDGENRVFPIQVSRQELLLFLGAVIVIDTYKNIVLYECPNAYSVNCLHLWAKMSAGNCAGKGPTQKWKLKGKKTSPSRSIVKSVIFIAVAVIFIFCTGTTNASLVPNLLNTIKNR